MKLLILFTSRFVKHISILVCLLILTSNGHAYQTKLLNTLDSLTARIYTLEDGLPVNSINSATQDNDGYLWLTTYDGLVKFDGLTFTVFNFSNTPVMPFNRTTQIFLQNNGSIWVSLENGGVLKIKEDTFEYFGTKQGLPNSDITKILEDKFGRVLFVTLDGLYAFENYSIRKLFDGENIKQNQISATYNDPMDGTVWLTTADGLVHIKDTSIKVYKIDKANSDNDFRGVIRTIEGSLIVGSKKGLYEIVADQLIPSKKYSEFKNQQIKSIYSDEDYSLINTDKGLFLEQNNGFKNLNGGYSSGNIFFIKYIRDRNGILWMIDNRGGLFTLSGQKFKEFDAINELKGVEYSDVFEDREGNFWLSTLQNGLVKLRNSNVRTLSVDEGLSGGNILGLLEDSKGRFWVGTRGAGLNLINEDKITHLNTTTGLNSNIVQSIAEDFNQNIWVGYHQSGMDRITDGKVTHYDLNNIIEANDVHSIYVSKKGEMWIGTYLGLVKFDLDNGNNIRYRRKDGLLGEKIRYITEDAEGDIWSASLDGGISEFKEGVFTNYSMDDGLSSNNVRSLYIDDDEIIWVGTENNGLNRIKNGKIDFVSVQNGLPDHNVHWITESDDGSLWLSTNKGVARLNKAELNDFLDGKKKQFQITHFDKSDGMRSPEGNGSFQEAGIKTSDGTIWFSTQDGVAIFNLNNNSDGAVFPGVAIESITAKDSVIKVNSLNEIRLDSGVDVFNINFHAITFKNPEKTKFRYKLSDYQEDWIETDEMEVLYSDLSPDTYQFLLQAANNSGEWGSDTASVVIIVQPKFRQTIWFYVLVIILLVIIYYLIIRFRYRLLLSRQAKMEGIIKSQTKQLREEKKVIEEQAAHLKEVNRTKDKFFSIIAHDLRNPFQAMIGYSDILYYKIDEEIEKDELKEGIEIIRSSSKTLYDLTENLLNWASLQTGKVKVEPTKFDLQCVVEKNVELYFQALQHKNITLTVKTDDSIKLFADKNMIDTIIRNLLSNAIKFTHQNGHIALETRKKDGFCEIIISDDGIGMSPEIIEGILSLDSKSMRTGTNNETGTGLGLVLCNDMVMMNNGHLKIDSTEGKGTIFTIELPLSESKETLKKKS